MWILGIPVLLPLSNVYNAVIYRYVDMGILVLLPLSNVSNAVIYRYVDIGHPCLTSLI